METSLGVVLLWNGLVSAIQFRLVSCWWEGVLGVGSRGPVGQNGLTTIMWNKIFRRGLILEFQNVVLVGVVRGNLHLLCGQNGMM